LPKSKKSNLDKYAGCLLGGAVGDALGAPIEFMTLEQIRLKFGNAGLTDYAEAYGRKGAITDDTQMTMFTAEGLLRSLHRFNDRGICSPPAVIANAYLRWLITQGEKANSIFSAGKDPSQDGFLIQIPELHARRAPGNSCLSALRATEIGSLKHPVNDSKGCGGVMRVAPIGLFAHKYEDVF